MTKITQLEKRIKTLENYAQINNKVIHIIWQLIHKIITALIISAFLILLISILILTVSASNLNIIIFNNTANFTYKEISNVIPCSINSIYTIPLNTQIDLWNSEIENIKLQSNCIAKSDYDNCVLEKSKKELEISSLNNNYNALEKENIALKERKCYSLNDINNRDKIILFFSIISIILFVILIIVILSSKLKKTIIINHEVKR